MKGLNMKGLINSFSNIRTCPAIIRITIKRQFGKSLMTAQSKVAPTNCKNYKKSESES